jgi:CBS domain-containing protein
MDTAIKDVMTTRVVAVKRDTPFKEMAARLSQHRVSAFPVIDDDGKVIGVVSEADMLAKEAVVASTGQLPGKAPHLRHRGDFFKAAAVTAADLMTSPAVTVSAEEPVTHAAQLMYSRKVKRLPVVDAANHLVGIVSRADVLTVYSRPDAAIREEILDQVILKSSLTDPGKFTVTVTNGIVTVEGHPETADSGRGIIARTWHVEGVVSVRDRLDYPPEARVTGFGPLY